MASFKTIAVTENILNCVPFVNTINLGGQALYRLAHKVDTVSPVSPGLKTTIKIHVISKDKLNFFESLPIIGNLIALGKLIQCILYGFHDPLKAAITQNNEEIIHLSLGNHALDDRDRASRIFIESASRSNNETFKKILNAGNWGNEDLLQGLSNCTPSQDNQVANANDILDFWESHHRELNDEEIHFTTGTIEEFLKKTQVALAGRIIGILPELISFIDVKDLLLNYSCAHYDLQDNAMPQIGVLREEDRNALIAKIEGPFLEQVKEYYGITGLRLRMNTTAENYREVHFGTLNKLLDRGFTADEIEEFIIKTFLYDEVEFIKSLITKYGQELSVESKIKILTSLPSSRFGGLPPNDPEKANLFEYLMTRWKNDISPWAHQLYTVFSQQPQLQNRLRPFKDILIRTFPNCHRAPEKNLTE